MQLIWSDQISHRMDMIYDTSYDEFYQAPSHFFTLCKKKLVVEAGKEVTVSGTEGY